jgi:hypothetical protein
MLLEDKIKTLLKRKAKLDLYKKLMVSLETEKVDKDEDKAILESEFPGLLVDFCNEVLGFCKQRMTELQTLEDDTPKAPKVQAKVEAAPQPAPVLQAPVDPDEPTDILKFAMKYRHLDGKHVTVVSPDGEVGATVVGMVMPFLKVFTDTGYTVDISPKDIKTK